MQVYFTQTSSGAIYAGKTSPHNCGSRWAWGEAGALVISYCITAGADAVCEHQKQLAETPGTFQKRSAGELEQDLIKA